MSLPIRLIISSGARIVTRNDATRIEESPGARRCGAINRIPVLMGLLGLFSSLFGISCSKKTIHCEFINAKDGATIAASDMPPEQLPETFAIATTLEMSGKKWSVERAEPRDKSDILKAGKVRVYLTPITMMPPGDILFSLPTISDDVGAVADDILPSPQILSLHEDDWRQVEFVAQTFSAEIEAELADIRRIYQKQRNGVGFKTVHVRKRIPNPLNGCNLPLRELESLLPPQKKFQAVGFQRTRGTIPHGFAWEIDEHSVLWGTTDLNGNVTRLCLLGTPTQKAASISDSFARLNTQHQLSFVDWCRATNLAADAAAIRQHFTDKR